MKILIIGEYYSANLGDGVICETVKYLVNENCNNCETVISDISGHIEFPDDTESQKHFESLEKTVLKKKGQKITTWGKNIISKLLYLNEFVKLSIWHKNKKETIRQECNREFDLAIFAGGQLFMDYFILSICDYIKYLSANNVPIVFNACGLGQNIRSKYVKKCFKEALNNKAVRLITTRDNINLLKQYLKGEKKRNVKRISDPAVWAAEAYNVRKNIISETVGLGVIWLPNKEVDMIRFWHNIIDELVDQDIKWKIFCNGSPLDYDFAIRILKEKGFTDLEVSEKLSERPKRPDELVELIATFKSLISFRLHSHIVAYSLDIPTVGIIWNDKVNFFGEAIDCSSRYFNLFEVEAYTIINALHSAEIEGYNQLIKENLKLSSVKLIKEAINLSNRKNK